MLLVITVVMLGRRQHHDYRGDPHPSPTGLTPHLERPSRGPLPIISGADTAAIPAPVRVVGAVVGAVALVAACMGLMTQVLRVVMVTAGAGAACTDTTKSNERYHPDRYSLCS
jgi:hypothetical protein